MSIMPGKRFLIVHLDQHRDQMGEILELLVNEFKVPVTVCDDIQQFCPKCSDSPGAKSDHNHDDHSKLSDNHQKRLPKVVPKNVPTQAFIKYEPLPPRNMDSPSKMIHNEMGRELLKFIQQGGDMRSNNSGGGSQQSTAQMSKRIVPPLLTVKGKPRNERIDYTTRELDILEKYYEKDPRAWSDPKKRDDMCKALPRHDSERLKNWFKNRRQKDSKKNQRRKDTDDSQNQQA